jgi:hypothetical protein
MFRTGELELPAGCSSTFPDGNRIPVPSAAFSR